MQAESSVPSRQVTAEIEVRYAETDQMGVVHHSVYMVWFEVARTRLCLTTGWHYAEIEKLGYQLVVTATGTRHLAPARFGDHLLVECRVDRLRSRILRFTYLVTRQGEKLAEGFTEHIWVDAATGRPCRIPEVLRDAFETLVAEITPCT